MNYITLTLTKEAKRFYNENCTKVTKETEKDIRKWKDLPYSQTRKMYIYYQKQSTDSTQLIKTSRLNHLIHKEAQKDLDSQSTAEQKHSAGAISIICCKFYHRAMAEQGTSTKQTRRSVEYQSQAKCKHMQAPDFGKHVKKYTLKQPLQQTVMIIKLHSHTQKNETGSLSLPCIKINCTGSKI